MSTKLFGIKCMRRCGAGVTGPAPVLSSGTGLAHPVVGELHAGRIGEADPTPLPPQGVPTQATHVEPARLRAPIKHEPMRDLPPGEPIAPYKPATVVTKDFVEPAGGLPSLGVMNSAPVAQSGVTSQPQVGAMDQGMQQPLSTPVEPLQAPAPTSSTSAGGSTMPLFPHHVHILVLVSYTTPPPPPRGLE